MTRQISCFTLILFVATLLTACGGRPIQEKPIAYDVVDFRPTGSDRCLALSGGGIRSGAVSIGILQQLHQENALAKFRYLSTVSGGGYPVYGLLYQLLREDETLDELLSENGDFITFADEEAAFIGNFDMYTAAVIGPTLWAPLTWLTGRRYGAAQPTYAAKIHNSFSGDLFMPFFRTKMSRAKNISEFGLPMPIFGTSASYGKGIPEDGYEYDAGEFFELSPDISGSPSYGYFLTFSDKVNVGEAIAMSAAAIDSPNGEFELRALIRAFNLGLGTSYRLGIVSDDKFDIYLADGGFIENLGLLPLLRRGCAEIVAFDNSEDPGATFNSWAVFEKRAIEEGWTISKPLQSDNEKSVPTEGDGWSLPSHLFVAELSKGRRTVPVRLLKLGMNKSSLQTYPIAVQQFATDNWKESDLGCNNKTGLDTRCAFPIQSTVRQSFSPRENKAYRYLGKCLALRALGKGRCDDIQ